MNRETGNKLLEDVESPVNKLGFRVVEVNSNSNRNRLKVNLLIYREEGLNLDDCSAVHKILFPRLEVIYDKFDLFLEVSSPGIERNFKDGREFFVFTGRAVKIMYGESNDWAFGRIVSAEEESVLVNFGGESQSIKIKDIHKCKLDYLKEVR